MQGWNPGFLHCRQIICHLDHQGSPSYLELIWLQKAKSLRAFGLLTHKSFPEIPALSCQVFQTSWGQVLRHTLLESFKGSLVAQMVKTRSACKSRDLDLIPGWGRSPGEGNGNPLQYSCLENSIDRGAWRATVHGVAKRRTLLGDFHFLEFLTPKCSIMIYYAAIGDQFQWWEISKCILKGNKISN